MTVQLSRSFYNNNGTPKFVDDSMHALHEVLISVLEAV